MDATEIMKSEVEILRDACSALYELAKERREMVESRDRKIEQLQVELGQHEMSPWVRVDRNDYNNLRSRLSNQERFIKQYRTSLIGAIRSAEQRFPDLFPEHFAPDPR